MIPCPECGCRDISELDQKAFADLSIYQCNHCCHKFSPVLRQIPMAERPMIAIFQKTACPYCHSTNNKITQGPRGDHRRRYHLCECGQTFPSKEIA